MSTGARTTRERRSGGRPGDPPGGTVSSQHAFPQRPVSRNKGFVRRTRLFRPDFKVRSPGLQWGRGRVTAESCTRNCYQRPQHRLQWGRGHVTAESAGAASIQLSKSWPPPGERSPSTAQTHCRPARSLSINPPDAATFRTRTVPGFATSPRRSIAPARRGRARSCRVASASRTPGTASVRRLGTGPAVAPGFRGCADS